MGCNTTNFVSFERYKLYFPRSLIFSQQQKLMPPNSHNQTRLLVPQTMNAPQAAFCNPLPSNIYISRPNQANLISPRTAKASSFLPKYVQTTLYRTKLTPCSIPTSMASIPDSVPSLQSLVEKSSVDEPYVLRETPENGDGIYATRAIASGETVMVGYIIKELSGNHSHATQVGRNRFIQHGGYNSKVNHSCDPNCGVHLNASGANNFVAMRSIAVGEEITFDYAMRNYVIEHFPVVCRCGAVDCRRQITGFKDLPARFRKRYEGFISPYLLEME